MSRRPRDMDPATPYGSILLVLKRRRLELGLSQEALEARIGLTPGHLAKYEGGTRSPELFHLLCWLQALRLEIKIEAAG